MGIEDTIKDLKKGDIVRLEYDKKWWESFIQDPHPFVLRSKVIEFVGFVERVNNSSLALVYFNPHQLGETSTSTAKAYYEIKRVKSIEILKKYEE